MYCQPYKYRSSMIPYKYRSSMIPYKYSSSMIPYKYSSSMIPYKYSSSMIPYKYSSSMIPYKYSSSMIPYKYSSSMIPYKYSSSMIPSSQSLETWKEQCYHWPCALIDLRAQGNSFAPLFMFAGGGNGPSRNLAYCLPLAIIKHDSCFTIFLIFNKHKMCARNIIHFNKIDVSRIQIAREVEVVGLSC